ncbi:MAG: DUF4363 family protein [Oscillibacter sp.]|jgi:hypothetical protein|nr:DUF4363 family protein [Oscillibacter sp.]
MKAFLPPILLLAAMLTFSLVNCAVIVGETDRWSQQLTQAEALAASDRWAEASSALRRSYRSWSAHQTWLHIVIKHESVDDAEAMYRRAAAFAAEREPSEFRAELADLRHQLSLVAEMERFSIKNIL